MSTKVGLDFGTSNSGVAVYDGQRVKLLPVDPQNVLPEVIKTVMYITRDYRWVKRLLRLAERQGFPRKSFSSTRVSLTPAECAR